jgi:hypothetical protein
MTTDEVKEQMQEDLMSLLEGFGIREAMGSVDWEALNISICDIVINNINKLKKEA